MTIIRLLIATFFVATLAWNCADAIWETEASVTGWPRSGDRDWLERSVLNRPHYTVRWRPRRVTNMRSQAANRPQIDAANYLLWRWVSDSYPPATIFRTGFIPVVDPTTALREDQLGPTRSPLAFDLQSYVLHYTDSVFVSTTQASWTPRSRAQRAYRYEIYAPGGIDVNLSLGDHQYFSQHEIAFFGGIRTEFIYGAIEYGEVDGHWRQVRYHRNPFYAGPSDEQLDRDRINRCRNLPTVLYPNLHLRRQQNLLCQPTQQRSKRTAQSTVDLMRTPGYIAVSGSQKCSFWYKVGVNFLQFQQSAEQGDIEPYGSVRTHIQEKSVAHDSSFVWVEYRANGDTPSMPQNTEITSLAKCLLLYATKNTGEVEICFTGHVGEYDPATANDEIASFSGQHCIITYPNSSPGKTYYEIVGGGDGYLRLGFQVQPCDESCIESGRFMTNINNGDC